MKKRYYLFTALGSYFLILIMTVPAKIVTDIINDNTPVVIQGVSGTVWKGQARTITVDRKTDLKQSGWAFSAWKRFLGEVAVDINTRYLDSTIDTELGSSFLGRLFVNHLKTTLAAEDIAEIANIPLVQLSGSITVDLEHAQWKQGEMPVASGRLYWKNATVTVAETASLGDVTVILGESSQQRPNADIKNQGGDIRISGNAELISQSQYAIDIQLAPSDTASDNIRRSLGLFAKEQSNGNFLLKNTGTLDQIGLI